MIRCGLVTFALLITATCSYAQDKEKKEVISFSGSGDGPIKTVDKDGKVEETDASTLNNINVIPGFSGPKYTFEDDGPAQSQPTSRTAQARTRSQSSASSSGDQLAQSERIDEMLKNRKRHLRRGSSGDRPPSKR